MKSYLFLLLNLTLLSCSKIGKNAGVEGRVVNPLNNEGIPDVSVEFVVKEQFSVPGGFKQIKATTTDENGYFKIHALRVLKGVYVQAQTDQNYHKIGWVEDGELISDGFRVRVDKGKTMHADFHAVPFGQTIFNIKNVNCTGPTDTMWMQHKSQFETDFPDWWTIPATGCYDYVSSTPSNELYSGERTFRLKIKRNGVTTFQVFTYNISSEGITNVVLHY